MKKILFFLFIQVSFSAITFADIKLPALVGDNMVLQQKSNIKIWGWAKKNTAVSIFTSWDNKSYQLNSNIDGDWQLNINTPKAGGPYEIKISDGKELILHQILIGEVWICSGQSNMEMSLRGNSSPVKNSNELILNADNKNIHLFRVKNATNLMPSRDVKGQWQVCTSATAREFSAIAYQFGAVLQKKLDVPVGLIMSSVGGTMIETWMSNSSLKAFPEVKIPTTLEGNKNPQREPTSLFNAMIAPLMNYGIKGVIWMQGESNRSEPELYGKLFPIMVADWRKQWHQGDFAFYYAQIAPCASSDPNLGGAKLREAQMKAMNIIPNSGMACLLDVGTEHDIHFMDKTTPAHRLAYWALAKTYGIDGIGYQGPSYSSMKIERNKAILTFDNVTNLTTYKKPLTLFEVAGVDKVFYQADSQIEKNTIIVSSNKVQNPVAVRYAFKEWALGELFNLEGLPASSFRTDNWN